jgi:hypothetical protein
MRDQLVIQTDRVYTIQRTPQGVVCNVNGRPLPMRLDLWNHSPTGFEFGYGGSGPAQLALILHEKVRSEALAIRHDANSSTVHADRAEGFASSALDALRQRRIELDPLHDKHYVEDHDAYAALKALPDKQVDALVNLLTVETITAHLQRRTELVWRLAEELGVEIRRYWRPDERWLSGYQKIQLAQLVQELGGPTYAAKVDGKKKSELVAELAKLFTDAAEGRLEDAKLAAKVNCWLPSNLREPSHKEDKPVASAA